MRSTNANYYYRDGSPVTFNIHEYITENKKTKELFLCGNKNKKLIAIFTRKEIINILKTQAEKLLQGASYAETLVTTYQEKSVILAPNLEKIKSDLNAMSELANLIDKNGYNDTSEETLDAYDKFNDLDKNYSNIDKEFESLEKENNDIHSQIYTFKKTALKFRKAADMRLFLVSQLSEDQLDSSSTIMCLKTFSKKRKINDYEISSKNVDRNHQVHSEILKIEEELNSTKDSLKKGKLCERLFKLELKKIDHNQHIEKPNQRSSKSSRLS